MKLIAVTNDKMPTKHLIETLLDIEPYIDAVILREKSKTDRAMLDLLQTLVDSGFNRLKIIVHGRADIASLMNCKRVQLPGHGLPLHLAKQHFSSISFGKSVHTLAEAKIAIDAGADWLVYGHLFETKSKIGLPPRGTDELLQMTQTLAVPIYAIGGIQPEHMPHLHGTRLAGIAVMSSIFNHDNPVHAAKRYYEAIRSKGGSFHEQNN